MTEMPDIQPNRLQEEILGLLGRQQRQPDPAVPPSTGGGSPEPASAPSPQTAAVQTGPVSITAPLASIDKTTLFVNREQSWLAFNRRVLEEAQDPTNPLLERVKFLAIASTNLDEFFEIRVAGVMELVDAGLQGENPDGIKPRGTRARSRRRARVHDDDAPHLARACCCPSSPRSASSSADPAARPRHSRSGSTPGSRRRSTRS
jgi:hypothetical protein